MFLPVLALCMAAQFLGACSDRSAVVSEKLHIGVTYYNQSDTFLNGLLESFREQLALMKKGQRKPPEEKKNLMNMFQGIARKGD